MADARTVGVRLAPDLVERLEVELERLERLHPTSGWTDAGVLRMAFVQYLDSQSAVTTADVA